MATLASLLVADDGWYITLCSTDHFGIVCGHATMASFKLKQTILLMIPQGYVRKRPQERVWVHYLHPCKKSNMPLDLHTPPITCYNICLYLQVEVLILGMFYRKGNRPVYDRQEGETIDNKGFDAQLGILLEQDDRELVGQGALRGAAERSLDFYRCDSEAFSWSVLLI